MLTDGNHARLVHSVIRGASRNPSAPEHVKRSWLRCLDEYGLDPESGGEPAVVSNQELVARKVPGARFTDGESLKTPLTREQIASTTGPYPTNMRRNITQGVPGLGIWYMTGRTEQNPNAWNETHIGLFSLVARSGEGVLKAQKDFADVARRLDMPSLFPNALQTPVNWYQFAFLMGNGFGLGRGDNSPAGKLAAGVKLRHLRLAALQREMRHHGLAGVGVVERDLGLVARDRHGRCHRTAPRHDRADHA